MIAAPDNVVFLGTAGARVMVTNQILASGGAWLNLGGTQILLDPGPGCLVQAIKRKLDPTKLRAILLSHKHLDHSNDINIMIEAMTEGGRKQRGIVFVPGDVLTHDPIIFSHLRSFPEDIKILTEGGTYPVDSISFKTPVRHKHPVETYGFVFETPNHTFSWITDSQYFDRLPDYYQGEVIIINVVRLEPGAPVAHLSLLEARLIIEKIKPKKAIITHFGTTMWRAKPWELAKRLTEETGISVIAAYDGMKFEF